MRCVGTRTARSFAASRPSATSNVSTLAHPRENLAVHALASDSTCRR